MGAALGAIVLLVVVAGFVLAVALSSIRIVQQSTVGIVERLGRFHTVAQRGVNFLIPFIDRMRAIIDLREQVADYPPQPVITRDNVTIQIDTVVYFQVTDAVKYTYEIANPRVAIEYLTATTLRNIIGEMDLDQTLTSRDIINAKLRTILDEATDKWGIKVTRVELKNITPPKDIQDAMERQMRAERERREVVTKAEGEKTAAILRAEGVREAAIRQAEGEKQARILQAEGEAQAILTVQQARAQGVRLVLTAMREAEPNPEVVALRSLEAMEKMAEDPAAKIIIPAEAAALLGALAGGRELMVEAARRYRGQGAPTEGSRPTGDAPRSGGVRPTGEAPHAGGPRPTGDTPAGGARHA